MHKLLFFLLLAFFIISCQQQKTDETANNQATAEQTQTDEEALLHKTDPAGEYGKGVALQEVTEITAILQAPEQFEGKTVAVSGEVAEVCPMRGCWMEIAQNGEKIRVKVKDGEIVFPLSAVGNPATVEGVVEKVELTEEKAREWLSHEAEERGENFDPASVTGPLTIWRIKGAGAIIKAKS